MSSNSTTTVKQPWAPSQPYLLDAMKKGAELYAQGPPQYSPFSQAANLTPLQLQAMGGITNYVNSPGTQNFMNNATGAYQGMIGNAPNSVQRVANPATGKLLGTLTNNNMYDPAMATNQMAYGNNLNPYVQGQVNSALQQLSNNFSMNTLPGLRRAAIGDGSYGSSRNEMEEGQAAGALSQDMYNTASQMYGKAYGTAQENALAALGLSANQQMSQADLANQLFNAGNTQKLQAQETGLNNYQNTLMMPLNMLEQQGQVGYQQYQQNQNALNDATNRWNFNQQSPWDNLNAYKAMIDNGSQYGGSGAGSSYQAPQPVNTAGLVTGGLLSAAGAGLAGYQNAQK